VKDDRFYLLHVRDAIERIRQYTSAGREAFLEDKKTQDAVIYELIIVGEAVKQISIASTSSKPEIPWKLIAGMRDVLIHNYFGVQLNAVWEVVETHLDPARGCGRRALGSPRLTPSFRRRGCPRLFVG
jgi:uncharacterized protein with HEPN domain